MTGSGSWDECIQKEMEEEQDRERRVGWERCRGRVGIERVAGRDREGYIQIVEEWDGEIRRSGIGQQIKVFFQRRVVDAT